MGEDQNDVGTDQGAGDQHDEPQGLAALSDKDLIGRLEFGLEMRNATELAEKTGGSWGEDDWLEIADYIRKEFGNAGEELAEEVARRRQVFLEGVETAVQEKKERERTTLREQLVAERKTDRERLEKERRDKEERDRVLAELDAEEAQAEALKNPNHPKAIMIAIRERLEAYDASTDQAERRSIADTVIDLQRKLEGPVLVDVEPDFLDSTVNKELNDAR
jgi:hypothetical protein